MAIALQSYHAARNVLPMSNVAGAGHGRNHSVFALLLPYLEQAQIHSAYNFNVENWHEANSTAVAPEIAVYLCPDVEPKPRRPAAQVVVPAPAPAYAGRSEFGGGHYAANWGGGRAGTNWGADFLATKQSHRGPMTTVVAVGPKGPTRCRRIEEISDGTSSTVAFGEKRAGQGWAVGGWAGSEFDVGSSPTMVDPDPTAMLVYSGSFHAGGAHFAFCDGSVRFVKASTNKQIWYAILTRDGKEIVGADAY
jgi:prepilin-type processing-associated H-X9-DG protein